MHGGCSLMTLKNTIPNEKRCSLLKQALEKRGFVRVIEAHNGLSAIIGNNTSITLKDNSTLEFDALWISSLTDSAARGNPDVEIYDFNSRLNTIHEIANVTNKPIIVDGDTGRDFTYFEYMVNRLERAGVSAIIIEDKKFPKRNSLESNAKQDLEDAKIFATKIKRGKAAASSKDFMIIARLESLIAGYGLGDALKRAKQYLLAGVDGIMIHSKEKTPENILKFAQEYELLCKELGFRKPLVCVPTTYNTTTEDELKQKGFNIVIHANHLLRSSHKAMSNVCKSILLNKRSFETDPFCSPVKEIFNLVGFDDITKKDAEEFEKTKLNVIIPAAGANPNLSTEKPCSMLSLGKTTVIEKQIEILKKTGLNKISVIRGFQKQQINLPNLTYYDNDDYEKTSMLTSLMAAQEKMDNGFIMVYSDILFNQEMIEKLIEAEGDIVVVADNSYQYHKHDVDKTLAVIRTNKKESSIRELSTSQNNQVLAIGTKLKKELAQYEFIGIAKFSKQGAENLKKIYFDCKKNSAGKFHEAESFEKAKITDILQEMIDRGFKVSFIEIHKGWMEIHSKEDHEKAKKLDI